MTIEARLAQLGITLGEPTAPKFSYIPVKQTGKLLYEWRIDLYGHAGQRINH